jgi:hypothetical protein
MRPTIKNANLAINPNYHQNQEPGEDPGKGEDEANNQPQLELGKI